MRQELSHMGPSAPVEMLRTARKAVRVELVLDSGDVLEARVLEVNKAGLALVTVKPSGRNHNSNHP